MAVTLKGQTAVYEGTSTDTKPTDADNNAIFKELDTGIRYYYDGTDWNEIPSSGGGGGGTGTDNYNELNNKPSINGTVLSGNKSLDNLGIQAKLTFDSAPTEDSENPVESGGVYSALAGKQDTISDLPTIRSGAAAGATAVQPADVIAALATKQDVLTTEQLAAVNSGVTSTDVEQIKTNKNNILFTATIGECESTSNTANKVVTVSDVNYTPHKGSIIAVKFKYGNNVTDTAEHPITLNVNNTGAYRIWYKNGDYANTSQGKVFGLSGYYIYYMYDGVDRWVWINYCMDNTYSLMSQAEASAGTATNERLINAKVLSDTIDEKLVPVENNILSVADQSTKYNYMDFNSYGTGNSGTIDSINTTTNTITVSGKAAWAKGIIYLNNVPSGTYRLKYTVSSNSSASAAITMNEGSTQKTSKAWNNATGDYISGEITFGDNAKSLYVTVNNSASSLSNSVSITITNVMLIPTSLYNAGFINYQPYAMSNAELTAAIQALQAQLNQ